MFFFLDNISPDLFAQQQKQLGKLKNKIPFSSHNKKEGNI